MNFGSPLTSWGIPGFFIVVLAGVIVYLYRDRDKWIAKYTELQNARLQDAKDSRDKIVEPMELLSRTTTLIYDKLTDGKR